MFKISSKTKIVGIFGYPIKHSLSPVMHNECFRNLKLDYVYVAFCVRPQDIKTAVESIRVLNIRGVNVTIPHKESVIKYIDSIHPLAEEIGAVNTIVNDGKKLTGYNTDATGFLRSLNEEKIDIKDKKVLLLGAGGAAKSISTVLVKNNIKSIFVMDIDTLRAKTLVEKLKLNTRKCKIEYIENQSIEKIIQEIDILINATPVGMNKTDQCVIKPSLLHKNLFVYDIIYNVRTKLIQECIKRKIRFLDGTKMLLFQAIEAFELWTDKKPPVNLMYNILLKERQKC